MNRSESIYAATFPSAVRAIKKAHLHIWMYMYIVYVGIPKICVQEHQRLLCDAGAAEIRTRRVQEDPFYVAAATAQRLIKATRPAEKTRYFNLLVIFSPYKYMCIMVYKCLHTSLISKAIKALTLITTRRNDVAA